MWIGARCAVLLGLLVVSISGSAQDIYDPTVLRTFALTFPTADWEQQLRTNRENDEATGEETLLAADLVVDGKTYEDVGVRIRGNSSFFFLPPGSQKFSLKIKTDHLVEDQNVQGYDNFNLNNGFHDPTFTREVVFNNYVAQFLPNPRANNVVVTINGENWGVYINVQQPNKRMLRDYFRSPDGLRANCSNNPLGPGLRYLGEDPAAYRDYEISDDGGFADPIREIITVSRVFLQSPFTNLPDIERLFAVDPSLWSVVMENAFSDLDSYIDKGCDFMVYRDPIDGRTHLLPRDNNETFRNPTWSPTRGFANEGRPVIGRLLRLEELRQRYMSHYRVILRDMNWDYFGPLFEAQRALIDAAVQADPKKVYSYDLFQRNFTETVISTEGLSQTLFGLKLFIDQRAAVLAGDGELVAKGPVIASVAASDDTPQLTDEVLITAAVSASDSPVSLVELYYRPDPTAPYMRVAMLDGGSDGDAQAGDGTYSAILPVEATPRLSVEWYVSATSGNSFSSVSFLPELAELGPNSVVYPAGPADGMRITEWMYSGASGEFVEFTNMSDQPIDMAGWSMDDGGATPGAFALSAFGVVQPGESVVVTDAPADDFRTAWGLAATVKIIGELGVASGNNLGRNDQIHLFNAGNGLEDQLFYGDDAFPGTIRTQNASGQGACPAIGQNIVADWVLSSVGDVFGSVAASSGDIGTPGDFARVGCAVVDSIFAHGFE